MRDRRRSQWVGPNRNRRHHRTPLKWLAGFFGLFVFLTLARAEISAPWLAELTTQKKPGAFTALENASFRYKFGWLGLKAGEGSVQLLVESDGTLKTIASGGTIKKSGSRISANRVLMWGTVAFKPSAWW